MRTSPNPCLDALHSNTKGCENSGKEKTGKVLITHLR